MSEDELEPLITECPNCRTRFRVSEAQLQIAGGRVRCGACLGVFHGVDNLLWDGRGALASGEEAEDVLDELLDELESTHAGPAVSPRAQAGAKAGSRPSARALPATDPHEARGPQLEAAREREPADEARPVGGRKGPRAKGSADWRDVPAALYGGYESLRADAEDDEAEVDARADREARELGAQALEAERREPQALDTGALEAQALEAEAPEADRVAAGLDWPPASAAIGPFEVLEPDLEGAWTDERDAVDARETEADERRDLDLETIALLESESLAHIDRSAEPAWNAGRAAARSSAEAPIAEVDRRRVRAAPAEGGLDPVLREEISFAREPRRWWPLIATAIGVLALIVQVFWYQFDTWGRDPAIRPVYAGACRWLGCELPVMQDLSKMRSRNLIVRSHPELAQALIVDAVIVNEWDYPQPFPELELVFRSVNGALVAGRRFRPAEYLAGELEGASEIAPRTPVRIELEIEDPGPDAVNYFLSFR